MNEDCKNINPLKRSGLNQHQRVLAALLPGFVKVDEREYPDLILFAKHYASFLKYFNKNNNAEGDWKPFMLMDVSVTLSSLIRLDIREFFTYAKDIYDQIQVTGVSQEADLKKYFKTIFDLGFSMSRLLDNYYKALPPDFEFKEVLGNTVHSSLPEYFDRLKKYYDEALSQNIIDPAGTFLFDDRPADLIFSQDFNASSLSDIWLDPSVPVFSPVYNGATTGLKIKNTATHNLFTGIIDEYLKILSQIVDSASGYLDKTLKDFPSHSPHYALYLTFIKLFRFSQDHLNTFTARHLDLYYKEILKLNKKEPVADKAHLTFELAKTAEDGKLLEKATVFKAGKDSEGRDIFYSLKDDVVLGKAKVASLKNIFVSKNIIQASRRVSAGTIANSEDGMGAKLDSADKSWKTFGDPQGSSAQAGFGIASDYLYLQEGERIITFRFYAPEGEKIPFNSKVIHEQFSLKLSSGKDWIEVPAPAVKVAIDPNRKFFALEVTLDGGDPPVVPYSQKIHGYNFGHSLPMALFILKNAEAKQALWDFEFYKTGIEVHVSGLKSLAIENDEGGLNPAKPFDLFGSSPHVGSSFIAGCKELFMKTRQASGTVNADLILTWDNFDEDWLSSTSVDILYLEDARWKDKDAPLSGKLFESSGGNPPESSSLRIELPSSLGVTQDYTPNENYSSGSKWGFFKLKLKNDLGHSTYARRLTEAIKIHSTTNSSGTTTTTVDIEDVTEPYTPKVKEISLNYSASTELDFSVAADGMVIHLVPFGHKDISAGKFPQHLMPQFNNEGELFIGFDELQTGQTLPVLFQVAEGTADPLTEKQEVVWHYLGADNTWIPFKKEEILDATNGLIKSGIIKFSIPAAASSKNTLMTGQFHWLKASVAEKTQAVCKLISVVAQAAVVQFFDYKNEGNYFRNTLPAGAISKLVSSDPAIKKIEQPYASSGGRTREDDASYYRWVSERLRHKQRAISMWDYERLVLEQFPEIYKVKCINHTQIVEKDEGSSVKYIDNELKPGHVLVVSVPDLHGKNAFDPLRPYTSLGTLQDIKKYLSARISPHVNLDVRNPRFEEIQLEFNVQYLSDDIELYTRQLRQELEQFLAPWAFDSSSDIEFGSKVSKSVLIDFIEERPYVDYISCVKMYCIAEGMQSKDLEEAIAGSARTVFVSVKSDDPLYGHIINEKVCAC